MVVCIDTSGVIYGFLAGMTTNVTGSFFLSTVVVSMVLIAIASFFKIPVEFSMILVLPFHLALLACLGSDWLGFTGVILIYLGVLLGKNLFFK